MAQPKIYSLIPLIVHEDPEVVDLTEEVEEEVVDLTADEPIPVAVVQPLQEPAPIIPLQPLIIESINRARLLSELLMDPRYLAGGVTPADVYGARVLLEVVARHAIESPEYPRECAALFLTVLQGAAALFR